MATHRLWRDLKAERPDTPERRAGYRVEVERHRIAAYLEGQAFQMRLGADLADLLDSVADFALAERARLEEGGAHGNSNRT